MWYQAQCDGEWEHDYGITIQSLDNPGWVVRIDLTGTDLQDATMNEVGTLQEINHWGMEGKHNWLYCKVENACFVGAGGPSSLLAICEMFRKWVEKDSAKEANSEID